MAGFDPTLLRIAQYMRESHPELIAKKRAFVPASGISQGAEMPPMPGMGAGMDPAMMDPTMAGMDPAMAGGGAPPAPAPPPPGAGGDGGISPDMLKDLVREIVSAVVEEKGLGGEKKKMTPEAIAEKIESLEDQNAQLQQMMAELLQSLGGGVPIPPGEPAAPDSMGADMGGAPPAGMAGKAASGRGQLSSIKKLLQRVG